MSTRPESDRSISAWLAAEAPDRAPERLLAESRERIRTARQRRAWWPAWRIRDTNAYAKLLVAAAAVAVVAVIGINLLPGLTAVAGPAASRSPLPSAAPSPPSAAPSLPSATPSPPSAAPSVASPSPTPITQTTSDDGVPFAGPVAPGRYAQTVGTAHLTFELEATDWHSKLGVLRGPTFGESLAFLQAPDWVGERECDGIARRSIGPTVADLAEAIKAIPGIRVTGPVVTTVGGRSATHLEVAPSADCSSEDPGMDASQFGGYLWGSGDEIPYAVGSGKELAPSARIFLWIVEVDGTVIVIEADLDPSAGPAFEEGVRRIVDSISFE